MVNSSGYLATVSAVISPGRCAQTALEEGESRAQEAGAQRSRRRDFRFTDIE